MKKEKELEADQEHLVYKRVTDPNSLLRKITLFTTFGVVIAAFAVAIFYNKLIAPPTGIPQTEFNSKVDKFSSLEEFKSYLANASSVDVTSYGFGLSMFRAEDTAVTEVAPSIGLSQDEKALAPSPDRVSETYNQVAGVDEPDIIKTNGTKIFFSRDAQDFYPVPLIDDRIYEEGISKPSSVPEYLTGETKIINSYPLDKIAEDSSINLNGNLLLYEDTLMVLDYSKITAYNIVDTKNPQKSWEYKYDGSYLQSGRLLDGKVYLILSKSVDKTTPCPIPLMSGQRNFEIACTDIYHPVQITNADTTYNALEIDATNGTVEKSTSFLGSSYSSVIYMSKNALYVTFPLQTDYSTFYYNFFLASGTDLIPTSVLEKIQKLSTYEISARAKFVELQTILEQYESTLKVDDRLKFESELTNKMADYAKDHARDLQATGIVKIGLENLDVNANGTVAGSLLNQFSLDEYDNHLRVATTIGASGYIPTESFNEVYVLDNNLKQTGAIKNLALDERIYSVRFLGDRGYVVTFKQVDPFFVLDLSNHNNPKVAGQLKIPGYSSLLHPLPENKILGIGREGNFVKLSLFDVSDPNNPTEVSKYLLDESWSEVLNNHHAFLPDDKFNAFFIPGGKGAYIFEYLNNNLSLVKTISEQQIKRAIYIDNYMFIVSNLSLIAVDERDWSTVTEYTFE